MDSQPNKYSTLHVWEIAGWIAVTAYSLLTILYLVPCYNPWYRVPVNLLNVVLFFIGIAAIAFVLIPLYLYKKLFYTSVACIALGFLFFFAAKHTYDWRVQLTEKLIQTRYCRENKVIIQKGVVLGGITNGGGVFMNDFHCLNVTTGVFEMVCAPLGMFINDSHRLIVVWEDEEFYYCDKEAERQSQQRQ